MLDFYKNKNVLITGHTGFKGSWLCEVLSLAGANITGVALAPNGENLYEKLELDNCVDSYFTDIRDLPQLKRIFKEKKPEVVIHMAAQPIVRESYKNPVETYDINVMGTVNILECIRLNDCVKSFVNVTTDKVYKNHEWEWGYRENEELNGYDPYSNSKSCSELVTESYRNSFFDMRQIGISTMRAGNVIGAGDFAIDRIIPDCIRAAKSGKEIVIRNPYSIRPYQHVLEPITAYLMVAEAQYKDCKCAGSYNIGPDEANCVTTGELVQTFCNIWSEKTLERMNWINQYDGGPHEANYLKLDCSKIKSKFNWHPKWKIEKTVEKTVDGYLHLEREYLDEQIYEYLSV